MTFKLDLTKSARTIQLDLSKRGVPSTVKAEGIINLDISDSFYHEYVEGTVDILVARLVPYGMVLDPDGKIDVFAYSDGESNAHYIGTVTPAEAENFVRRQIFGKVAGWRGGTSYSYVFEKNLQHFGWLPTDPDQAPAQRPRFWDRVASALFGDDSAPAQPVVQDEVTEQKRSIVFHVSDGEINHDDYNRAMRLLEDSERRGDNVFFQMIAIGLIIVVAVEADVLRSRHEAKARVAQAGGAQP